MIEALEEESKVEQPFGKYEEEAITSLMLDFPEYFINIGNQLKAELFSRLETKYVVAHILTYFESYGCWPTRSLLRDIITKQLTTDDIAADDIIQIIDRPSNPREIAAIRDKLIKWAKHKSYQLLWSQETISKFNSGDYEYIDKVVDQARRVQEIGGKSLDFFKELEKLFAIESTESFTTGFHQLNHFLDGGPKRKEMFTWMAPTGVGKSIALINNAVANIKKGQNVLYITLELSDVSSAIRALGVLTGEEINTKQKLLAHKDKIISKADHYKKNNAGDLLFYEFPPDEISVDAIYALVDELKRNKAWIPDVIIIDYLELLLSRRESDNSDSYTRQKAVSTQVRGIAKNCNVVVFTATQTNRSGNDKNNGQIDVTNIAESYGKAMPMDYLISINQSIEQYQASLGKGDEVGTGEAMASFYIAKARGSQKFKSVTVKINYKTMAIKETQPEY